MKYTPYAMKFGNQNRLRSLIKNMMFEIADLDPKKHGQIWSQNCNLPDYYEIWHSEQVEHANY